jgi:hypothetical protein
MARYPLFYHLISYQFPQVLNLLLLQFDHMAYSFPKDFMQFLSCLSDPHYIMLVPYHVWHPSKVFPSHSIFTKQLSYNKH